MASEQPASRRPGGRWIPDVVAIRRGVDFTEIAPGDVADPAQMVVDRQSFE